jgi:hypothetical protein
VSLEISEDLVSLAYQNLGYFVIEGRQVGHNEIDLLCVKLGETGQIEKRLHVEMQIGINPIGVLSGNQGDLSKNSDPASAAKDWIERKYRGKGAKVEIAVGEAFGGQKYERVFVYGKMRDERQLKAFTEAGVRCKKISELVNEAEEGHTRNRLHRTVEIAKLLTTI